MSLMPWPKVLHLVRFIECFDDTLMIGMAEDGMYYFLAGQFVSSWMRPYNLTPYQLLFDCTANFESEGRCIMIDLYFFITDRIFL